jgi:hypothetical protein
MIDHRDDIEKLAYALWEERGKPDGSPETDWFRAERELERTAHALSDTTSDPSSEAVFDNEGGHITEERAGRLTSHSPGKSRGMGA